MQKCVQTSNKWNIAIWHHNTWNDTNGWLAMVESKKALWRQIPLRTTETSKSPIPPLPTTLYAAAVIFQRVNSMEQFSKIKFKSVCTLFKLCMSIDLYIYKWTITEGVCQHPGTSTVDTTEFNNQKLNIGFWFGTGTKFFRCLLYISMNISWHWWSLKPEIHRLFLYMLCGFVPTIIHIIVLYSSKCLVSCRSILGLTFWYPKSEEIR